MFTKFAAPAELWPNDPMLLPWPWYPVMPPWNRTFRASNSTIFEFPIGNNVVQIADIHSADVKVISVEDNFRTIRNGCKSGLYGDVMSDLYIKSSISALDMPSSRSAGDNETNTQKLRVSFCSLDSTFLARLSDIVSALATSHISLVAPQGCGEAGRTGP